MMGMASDGYGLFFHEKGHNDNGQLSLVSNSKRLSLSFEDTHPSNDWAKLFCPKFRLLAG